MISFIMVEWITVVELLLDTRNYLHPNSSNLKAMMKLKNISGSFTSLSVVELSFLHSPLPNEIFHRTLSHIYLKVYFDNKILTKRGTHTDIRNLFPEAPDPDILGYIGCIRC